MTAHDRGGGEPQGSAIAGDPATPTGRCMAALEELWVASLDLPEGELDRFAFVVFKAGELIGAERCFELVDELLARREAVDAQGRLL